MVFSIFKTHNHQILYQVGYISELPLFQNIDFDRDASKLEIKDPSFLEHSPWDQRVNNKHVYSDNDHRQGIKAPSLLELPFHLQIIQFLV